jgi:hypothetical protein
MSSNVFLVLMIKLVNPRWGVGGEGCRSQVGVAGTVVLRSRRVELGIVAVAVGYIAGGVCVLGLSR